ncbi:hypothetical protein MNBD_ALPHA08-1715 [hydrothermal vent metagenome]|uniref:Uncharacterized protein n=1 Tax=hydrothermal vent metagenome TaxID=652676 RepID=A0A3B0RYN9_9ZZZZ
MKKYPRVIGLLSVNTGLGIFAFSIWIVAGDLEKIFLGQVLMHAYAPIIGFVIFVLVCGFSVLDIKKRRYVEMEAAE